MDLKECRNQIHGLPEIHLNVQKLQENWVKSIRSNTNYHLPSIHELDSGTRDVLRKKLALFQETVQDVKKGRMIQQKLSSYARYLIELKLAILRDDKIKAKHLIKTLLHDKFFNFSETIKENELFSKNVSTLKKQYDAVNQFLQKELPLDEVVILMDLPHKHHLRELQKAARDQKKIVKNLGNHFVTLAKEQKK